MTIRIAFSIFTLFLSSHAFSMCRWTEAIGNNNYATIYLPTKDLEFCKATYQETTIARTNREVSWRSPWSPAGYRAHYDGILHYFYLFTPVENWIAEAGGVYFEIVEEDNKACNQRRDQLLPTYSPNIASTQCMSGCEYAQVVPVVPQNGVLSTYTPTGNQCQKDGPANNPEENLGDNDRCNGQVFAGNPINIGTGNKFQSEVDFASVVDGTFALNRFYNSQSKRMGYFGLGWSSNLDIRAEFVFENNTMNFTSAKIVLANGRVLSFRKINGEWKDQSNLNFRLSQTSVDWELIDRDGTSYRFDNYGRLTKSTDLLERSLSYFYDGTGIDRVEDNFGGIVNITVSNGLVQEILDQSGYKYRYNYSGQVLTGIVYYDPSGAVTNRTYHYENTAFPDHMTGITDERGLRFSSWSYDSLGNANSSSKGAALGGGSHYEEYNLSFNSDGTTTVTNPVGKDSVYHFAIVNGVRKTVQVDGEPSDNCAASYAYFSYDGIGFKDKVTDRNGNVTDFDYSVTGFVNKITEGLRWSDGTRTTTITTPETRITEQDWDETTRQIIEKRAPGLTTRYDYWPSNRLKQITRTDTTTETNVFGSTQNQQRIWKYSYTYFNGTNLPVDVLVDTMTIDGPLSGITDKVVYRYNQQGQLLSITNALNQVVNYGGYNGRGQPQTVTDANGVVTNMSYHPRGWLETITVKDPSGNAALNSVTRYTWYPNGTLEQLTFPDGSFLHYEYNDARHLIEIRNNLDEQITFKPNAMGEWMESRTYSASADMRRLQTRAFDELGRLMDLFGNNSQHTHYGYDTNDNLNSIVENGTDRIITATMNHDSLNRLKEVLKPVTTEQNGLLTTVDVNTYYQYDKADNLTQITDPKGNNTQYRYNGFGERIKLTSPDTGVTQYWYTAQGNLSNRRDARGVNLIYHYDLMGRLTRIQYPQTSNDVRYYYDEVNSTNPYAKGRLTRIIDPSGSTRYRYDHRGNLTTDIRVIGGKTYRTEYNYNLANNLAQITFPGGRLVNYERNDALGRVSAVTTQQTTGSTVYIAVNNIQYQPFGPITGYVHGNGLTRQVPYDLDYRIDRISVTGTGTTKPLDLDYDYDAFDNIQQILNGADTTRSEQFTYDDLHRLQHAYGSYGTNTNHVRYEYDPVGNRTLQVFGQNNLFHTSESYVYSPSSNQLMQVTSTTSSSQVRNLQYTAAGSVGTETTFSGAARTYNYNDNNRLINLVENTATKGIYQYNALGQRVLKTANGITRYYLYGPEGELLVEAKTTGEIARHYLYLEGQIVAIVDK